MTIVALTGGVALLLALGVGGWLVLNMRSQQNRLVERLDTLANRLSAPIASSSIGSAISSPAAAVERVQERTATAGDMAPAFELDALGGGRSSLAGLLARAKPLLLVFTHPRCGPCYELLPDIGGWQRMYGDRLTITLLSADSRETNLAMTAEYGIQGVLLQHEQAVADAYGIVQMPGALLITPDGRIAAQPSYGVHAIRQLVAGTLGLVLPEAPAVAMQTVEKGRRVPSLRRPDLAGNVIDLAAPRPEPTLLLFWSPGCTHCRDLLPDIRALEERIGPQRMTIVSRGPIGLNEEIGFRSTVLLDDDSSIGRTFGVTGTPAAVLLDQRAVVATPVARGVAGVRSAMTAVGSFFGITPATAAD